MTQSIKILLIVIGVLVLGAAAYAATSLTTAPTGQACTTEAKLCPDGSYVGRSGPNCEFAACPEATTTPSGAPVVGAGAHCGGNIMNAPVCGTGYHCQLVVSRPDTGGTCVADNQGILPYNSGIQGSVTTGPTCPVERNPPDPACADKPYATLVAVYRASDATHAVALLRSDASGYYKVSLPPGAYMVQAGESNLPRCTGVAATVGTSGYTTADISCDTGIR